MDAKVEALQDIFLASVNGMFVALLSLQLFRLWYSTIRLESRYSCYRYFGIQYCSKSCS